MRGIRTLGKARLMSDLLSETILEMVGRTNCICFSESCLVGLGSDDKQRKKRWVKGGGCCSVAFSLVADMVVQVQVCEL
jgi:hypothetical protein